MSEVAPSPIPASVALPRLGIARSIVLCLVFYIFVGAASGLLDWITRSVGIKLDGSSNLLLLQIVAWPLTILLGLQWMKASFREACPLRPIPLRILPPLFVASLGAIIVLNVIVRAMPMPEEFAKFLAEQFAGSTKWTMFLPAVVMAPVAEELFFRGVILRGYLGRYSVTTAVLASAMLFAAFHLNQWQFVTALPLGVWYAWMVLRTGSLWPGIVSHATVNFSGFYLLQPVAEALGIAPNDITTALSLGGILAALGGFILWRQLASIPPPPGIFSTISLVSLNVAETSDSQTSPAALEETGREPHAPTYL